MGIVKLLMSVAAAAAALVTFNIIKKKNRKITMKRSFRSKKQSVKTRKLLHIKFYKFAQIPRTMHDKIWTKIGIVDKLKIYPIKSSEEPMEYPSFEFRDYGMYRKEHEIDFWDGMFLLYNKTKGKFEDSRTHSSLQSVAVNVEDGEIMLSGEVNEAINLDITQYDDPANYFLKETWNGMGRYSSSNQNVNAWLKDAIETNEDVILAQMRPRVYNWIQSIRNNWSQFADGYNALERDETGKFITLPRFVLMTSKTELELSEGEGGYTPNIIIEINEDVPMNIFQEQNWQLIRLGTNVILKNVKPVPSPEIRFPHYGIYCGLWSNGHVTVNDEVFLSFSNV